MGKDSKFKYNAVDAFQTKGKLSTMSFLYSGEYAFNCLFLSDIPRLNIVHVCCWPHFNIIVAMVITISLVVLSVDLLPTGVVILITHRR